MILTAMAMYLNTVYEAGFDYVITVIGDLIIGGIFSVTVNQIVNKK